MTWIKICGITTPEAVSAALASRVEAIGFVFAESVRQLTPSAAVRLAAPARGRLVCIAVTRRPTQQAIDEIMSVFQPDVLQTDAEDLCTLRLPEHVQLLPVFRSWNGDEGRLPRRLLFEGPVSGSGAQSDWKCASRLARNCELILAGGLNAANVAAAITGVRPFGVDVSSGVEQRPGIKSPAEIARFVNAVRSAGSDQGAPHAAHGCPARDTPVRR
jgi:phosphoribosylanthranilate isomerase